MKILFICKGHFDSGIALYKSLCSNIDIELLIDIEGERYTQSVIDAKTGEIELGLHTDLTSEYDLVRQVRENFNLQHQKISIVKYHSLSLRDFRNCIISRKVVRWIKEKKFDLIHYNGSSLPWLQQMVLSGGIPRVITVHDYILHSGESEGGAWQYRFYMQAITKKKAHYFHLLSETMRDEFCRYYGVQKERTIVAKFGPFESYRKQAGEEIRTENRTILYFGRISPYKGVEYLVEAGKILQNSIPDLKIIIAGAGDIYFDKSVFEQNPLFELHNYHISNTLVAQLFQRSSLVVCPYTDATQSGVVMTAYAFHKPVIATDVGSFREYIIPGETGALVPPKNSAALAEAIKKLLMDPESLARMQGNISRLWDNNNDWIHAAAYLEKYYIHVLNKLKS